MNINTNSSWKGSITDNQPQTNELFDQVTTIIEQARVNVVRSVNNQMVTAYWLIGREIVEAAPWYHLLKGERINDYNLNLTGKQAIQKAKENKHA
ncbi:MAG: hypothetical protein ACT6FD_04930 [Methanosarcinaceae archaeon]